MMTNNEFAKKYDEVTFSLSKEDIFSFDKEDNGPINNVISRIRRHCFGAAVFEVGTEIHARMYYINNDNELTGDLIELCFDDKQYFPLVFQFCVMLADKYEDVDAISSFNVFHSQLRGFLEKMGFFTITDLELAKYEKDTLAFVAHGKRGIMNVRMIDRVSFYRTYLDNVYITDTSEVTDYVYLMVNDETGLIKIGTSKKPKYREGTLHSKEPSVEIIALWRCNKAIEKELHYKFDKRRVRGEWFKLSVHDLKQIGEYMDKYVKQSNQVDRV